MFSRHIEPFLVNLMRHFPCVAVTGVRQCGKATLLGMLPGEWRRFDMETVADREQVLGNPDLFLRLNDKNVIIDEAQLASGPGDQQRRKGAAAR